MKSNQIRIAVILGSISIIGIIVFQLYWVNKSFGLAEQQFNRTVEIALYNVADKMVKPKNYSENAMIEAALAELEQEISEQDAPPSVPDEDEEDKELDVDKEMAKEQALRISVKYLPAC